MTVPLSELTLRLLDGPNFAVLATTNTDNSPQTSMMWIGRDGEDLVFSARASRLKNRNIKHQPSVSVILMNAKDPYEYVEIRGTATVEDAGGWELHDALSVKYDGKPADPEPPDWVRVVIRVQPQRLRDYPDNA